MNILVILQIIVSIAIIVLVLLQERSAGASGILGGGGEGEFYAQRRGFERIMHNGTIALVIIFAVLSLLQLVL